MNWLQQLTDALTARGIRGQDRRRIVAELRDHIECEPGCAERLGDPVALAGMFADELATGRTREWAWRSFGALAGVALVLAISLMALARGRYPGYDNGLLLALFWPALFGMFVAPQAALVAGTLAAVRALRRRRCPRLPAAELALIARRSRVALLAGGLTVAGIELYVIDFSSRLPTWWLTMTGTTAAIAGAGLVRAWRGVAGAGVIVAGTPGPAGDVFDDLPAIGVGWLRGRPWRLGALASLVVGVLMTLLMAHAERSLIEGLERGLVEALAAGLGFALLGRVIGVASPRARGLAGSLGLALPGHRVGDHEREHAEAVVRVGYADGRLSLEELSARVEAIHTARTAGELCATIADLPEL